MSSDGKNSSTNVSPQGSPQSACNRCPPLILQCQTSLTFKLTRSFLLLTGTASSATGRGAKISRTQLSLEKTAGKTSIKVTPASVGAS